MFLGSYIVKVKLSNKFAIYIYISCITNLQCGALNILNLDSRLTFLVFNKC